MTSHRLPYVRCTCEHIGRIFVKNFIYFLPLKTASLTSCRRSGEVFSFLSLFLPFPSRELNIVCMSSRDRCSTHRSRFLSFRDQSRPVGTGPGETGTGDFPLTTLRTCSRTYCGSCRPRQRGSGRCVGCASSPHGSLSWAMRLQHSTRGCGYGRLLRWLTVRAGGGRGGEYIK